MKKKLRESDLASANGAFEGSGSDALSKERLRNVKQASLLSNHPNVRR
jgi:hypothetical protein